MVGEHNSYFIIVCKYKRNMQFKFNSNSIQIQLDQPKAISRYYFSAI